MRPGIQPQTDLETHSDTFTYILYKYNNIQALIIYR